MNGMLDDTMSRIRQHSLGDVLRRTATRVPDKVGIICGKVQWTYAQFDRICTRLAESLLAMGVRPGDRVAILSRNSHAFAAMRFALARMGAVMVPINFMLNADEVAFILKSSGATTLLVGAGFESLGASAAAKAATVERSIWLPSEDEGARAPEGMAAFDDLLAAETAAAPLPAVDSRSLLQIIYTSGTESLPKGAMLCHDAVLWEYVSCIIEGGMASGDVLLHALPLYHCAQLDVFLGPGVYLGTTNVITGQPKPEAILPLIERHRVNSFFAPPWSATIKT